MKTSNNHDDKSYFKKRKIVQKYGNFISKNMGRSIQRNLK